MSTATITVSSKGQVVIPKQIRDELRWEAGTETHPGFQCIRGYAEGGAQENRP